MTAPRAATTRRLYLTPEGYRRLVRRIEEAREAYLAVCSSNEEAAGSGDSSVWHDNFAYEENQRRMHQLAGRVRDLEAMAGRAQIVPPAAEAPERVRIGCAVRVLWVDEDVEHIYYVAGWQDGDPVLRRISYASPLGAALIGAEEGDLRELHVDGNTRELEIVELLPAPEGEER